MSALAQKLLTAEDLTRLHGSEYVELIDGVVKELPMPKSPHGFVNNRFAHALTNHVDQHSLGRVANNDTFVLTRRNPDRVRGADIAFWSYQRVPRGIVSDELIAVPPELVVEVCSPTDRWKDVMAQVNEYLDAGVGAVVVVDPAAFAATIYRPIEFPQVFHNGDMLTMPDILPGFAMKLSDLFKDIK